jgi:hypothetical protein
MIVKPFKDGDKLPMWVDCSNANAIEPVKPIKKKLTKHEADGKDKSPDDK